MHETGLGHIIGQQLGELMGQGERSRCLSYYIGPLFSEVEHTLQEKGLGCKGDGGASMRSPEKIVAFGKKQGKGEIDTQVENFQQREGTQKSIPEDDKMRGSVTKGRKLSSLARKKNGSGIEVAAVQPY